MSAPPSAMVAQTHGYHPLVSDAVSLLSGGHFRELLILGTVVPDAADHVGEVRVVLEPPVDLPVGVYWFSRVDPPCVLLVSRGAAPSAGLTLDPGEVAEGSSLEQALRWLEYLWEDAAEVVPPSFRIGDEILTARGEDGVIRARDFVQGRWLYIVFAGGRTQRLTERSLRARPQVDDPTAWVKSSSVGPTSFAATLTRAKLDGHFTDTVFSFRATRTLFRPYQFKPVMKLLTTGSLRMLIADEVGLGKTIEAGLLWTELEARRRADRVLVVCPSSLVAKWQREMDERFGFELVELTAERLADLMQRLETGRQPRRAAYVCSIERLRTWPGLGTATDLGLQFDLAIADEAHAFRNSDTKSHALGEYISQWSDASVMLSATPVNLRNQDLFNLLGLLVPGEFGDLVALEERIGPNAVLHRVTGSLFDPDVSNADRISWLKSLSSEPLGRALMGRPDFRLLLEVLRAPELTPHDVVRIKRLCSELHGLSAEVTRTRKVEVQEDKAVREPHLITVNWTAPEHAFYDAYYTWCVERAKAKSMPLYFSMQMPLRLAGSCLPEAAQAVLNWNAGSGVLSEENQEAAESSTTGPDVAPGPALTDFARQLDVDTKYAKFRAAIVDLVTRGKRTIVFTFSRKTLAYLQRRLEKEIPVAVLHGGVAKDSRDRIMADFRDGAYVVLLATRVASEGLDFEFCSALVNYDLPWNPMEVEQRIGRIDRIGQTEAKILVLNFHTPGTIETDIIERVMTRIGVFEHAIGALEPILETKWSEVQSLLFDFTLTPQQRDLRTKELLAALEEKALALADVESASPYLISSDGIDIDGLESDLLSSGRYVGQRELALLVADWASTYGGKAGIEGERLTVIGNAEMASHVQRLVDLGERTRAEVDEIMSDLRNEFPLRLAVDQETSRVGGLPLITATHPVVRAACGVPGHRQGRLAKLRVPLNRVDLPEGDYLTLLSVAKWNGVRPLHEVWSSSVDLGSLTLAPERLGEAVMAQLAEGNLTGSSHEFHQNLEEAVELAARDLATRTLVREDELMAENDAIADTRKASLRQVHERRMAVLEQQIRTLLMGGHYRVLPAAQGQLKREQQRYETRSQELVDRHAAMLGTSDLAVCLVEVSRV